MSAHRLAAPLNSSSLPALVWDLTVHPASLGGALTLRVEAEMMARAHGAEREEPIIVLVREAESGDQSGPMLLRRMFLTSAFNFAVASEQLLPFEGTWPEARRRDEAGFTYYSYDRVTALHREHGLTPRLQWSAGTQAQARKMRRLFGPCLICVHLRNTAGGATESNADFDAWHRFFRAHARPGSVEFLLLGDDPLGAGWSPVTGVHRAADSGIDLVTQLALVEQSEGYLGMASGIGCAANFSAVPHVLFKHPEHHAAAMQQELGDAERYPFFTSRQALWRREANFANLQEAFAFISV